MPCVTQPFPSLCTCLSASTSLLAQKEQSCQSLADHYSTDKKNVQPHTNISGSVCSVTKTTKHPHVALNYCHQRSVLQSHFFLSLVYLVPSQSIHKWVLVFVCVKCAMCIKYCHLILLQVCPLSSVSALSLHEIFTIWEINNVKDRELDPPLQKDASCAFRSV